MVKAKRPETNKQKCECCKKECFELVVQRFEEGPILQVCEECKQEFDEGMTEQALEQAREAGIEW